MAEYTPGVVNEFLSYLRSIQAGRADQHRQAITSLLDTDAIVGCPAVGQCVINLLSDRGVVCETCGRAIVANAGTSAIPGVDEILLRAMILP